MATFLSADMAWRPHSRPRQCMLNKILVAGAYVCRTVLTRQSLMVTGQIAVLWTVSWRIKRRIDDQLGDPALWCVRRDGLILPRLTPQVDPPRRRNTTDIQPQRMKRSSLPGLSEVLQHQSIHNVSAFEQDRRRHWILFRNRSSNSHR
jgi:hypothetical protein